MEKLELLFATGNAAKLAQLRFVAESLQSPLAVLSARELHGDLARYEEEAETLAEIARQGALEVAARIGRPVVTEDSGFFVDALGGGPGAKAKDFLAQHGRHGLLAMLEHESERYAAVASAACYATPDGRGCLFEHLLHGRVADEERWGPHPPWVAPQEQGSTGGGFNAVFIPDGQERTLAEIAPREALGWSYREKTFHEVVMLVADPERLKTLPLL